MTGSAGVNQEFTGFGATGSQGLEGSAFVSCKKVNWIWLQMAALKVTHLFFCFHVYSHCSSYASHAVIFALHDWTRVFALKRVLFHSHVPPWAPPEVLEAAESTVLREVRKKQGVGGCGGQQNWTGEKVSDG